MFKVISKWQRESADVPFYRRDDSASSLATEAKIAGKLISEETFVAPDKLTLSYVECWDSIQSYSDFNAIPGLVAYIDAREAHNTANNIVLVFKKTETISA